MAENAHSQNTSYRGHWMAILCLVGLDYFSTLAYLPSLAFESAGLLTPFATLLVVLATLCGALPIYLYVARRSTDGQGAIGLLEQLIPGWFGKLLLVTLLGFAAADFVMTRTLSAADAAEHLIHNPLPAWQEMLQAISRLDDWLLDWSGQSWWQHLVGFWDRQLAVTVVLSAVSFLFWAFFRHGFTRGVVRLSVAAVAVYLGLTALILVSGLTHLFTHGELVYAWWEKLNAGFWHPGAHALGPGSLVMLTVLVLISFPKLALGMSGFELSMVVLPLIRDGNNQAKGSKEDRYRAARKLLVVSVVIMALFLLASAVVTTVLVAGEDMLSDGRAAYRTFAYLAHGGRLSDGQSGTALNPLFGPVFGSIYDLATLLILCLAGASVTIGLRDLVPEYLYKLGMELEWAHRIGGILYVFNAVNLAITLIFRASVSAQRGAYVTSVLVLISAASVAVVLGKWKARQGHWMRRLPWVYFLLCLGFHAATITAIIANPSGLILALAFVAAILTTSVFSRTIRTTESRFEGFEFVDTRAEFLWKSLVHLEFPVLVPHRPGNRSLVDKETAIRERHRLPPEMPVVFLEVHLGDASAFLQRPLVSIDREDGRIVVRITRCASIPHVIASAALELSRVGRPPEIHFGWSHESPTSVNLSFLLFGEGNVPWMVRELLLRAEPNPKRRPPVVIG